MKIEEVIDQYCERVQKLNAEIQAELQALKAAFQKEGLQIHHYYTRADKGQLLAGLKQARERKKQEEDFKEREVKNRELLEKLNLGHGQAVKVVYDYSYHYQQNGQDYKTTIWGYYEGVKPNYAKKECLTIHPRNPKDHKTQVLLGYLTEIVPTTDPFPVEALKTKKELYERATILKIPGRSKLSTDQLRMEIKKLEDAGEANLEISDEHPAFICD